MSFKYQHLTTLTDNELNAVLTLQGKRPIEREQIKAEVRAYKDAKRVESSRTARYDVLWRELIEPLSNEQRTVYNMKRYAMQGYSVKARMDAIEAYSEVLNKLNKKLRGYWQQYKQTPKELATDKGLPNGGTHWTDWVPEKVKGAVIDLFDEIPRTFKAKVKTPFERTIPKGVASKKKTALIRKIKTETGHTEKEIAMLTDLLRGESNEELREAQEHLKKLEAALRVVLSMAEDQPVPHVWQELVK